MFNRVLAFIFVCSVFRRGRQKIQD